MEYVDKKYINIISNHLRNFKWKSSKVANFSCPICGDSTISNRKARGYLYTKDNHYIFKCHNCGVCTSFAKLLKTLDETTHKQYVFDVFKETNSIKEVKTDEKIETVEDYYKNAFKADQLHTNGLLCMTKLSITHIAKKYVENRKIPKKHHKVLYYSSNFKKWAESTNLLHTEHLVEDERLVIPFFDKTGKSLLAVQGRSLDRNCKVRYITLRLDEKQSLIYGLERLDYSSPIMVTEGPLDSLFLPNAVAMATAGKELPLDFPHATTIMIYDNEPRNVQIVKYMEKAINNGFRVCLWPAYVNGKDVNEMVLNGLTEEAVCDIIKRSSWTGLIAKTKLSSWRKC